MMTIIPVGTLTVLRCPQHPIVSHATFDPDFTRGVAQRHNERFHPRAHRRLTDDFAHPFLVTRYADVCRNCNGRLRIHNPERRYDPIIHWHDVESWGGHCFRPEPGGTRPRDTDA